MPDTAIRAACQTFTWEMLGDAFKGGPDDLLAAIASGGYQGIEITDTMIGSYAGKPEAFARALKQHGLTLVAFAAGSSSGFTEPSALAGDLDTLRRHLDFTAAFDGAVLSLGSATVMSEGTREDKFRVAAELYNRAAELGRAAGVTVAVHPSSHHNTLLFDRADYDRIFALLDADTVGWVPDTGHILRGGMDLAEVLDIWRDRIRYIHLKDVDASGDWAMLGAGVCDTAGVIARAQAAPRFNGWLVVEEESGTAAADPAAAVRANRETLRRYGV